MMSEPGIPGWVNEFLATGLRHAMVRFEGVRGMDAGTFSQRVAEAYRALFEEISDGAACYPVRFWAFIPGIHDDLGAGLDRYMGFNAGRHLAFSTHYRQYSMFDGSIPTGSAVGVGGDEFVLHCLAADEAGVPIENPRQVSAYHYSRRFGPVPPRFARATLLGVRGGASMLIVGGTASITGEDSRHVGDLHGQAQETFRNLASVVTSACGGSLSEDAGVSEIERLLAMFHDIRVYYARAEDRAVISRLIQDLFPSTCKVEFLNASLCRPELLVEIEGMALPPIGRGN